MSKPLAPRILARLRLTLLRLLQAVRIAIYQMVSSNELDGRGLQVAQPVHALGEGNIILGRNVKIGVFPSPGYLSGSCYIEARASTSEILIGDDTSLNNGFTAIAESSKIQIGRRCLIGPNVTLLDSDFHGTRVSDRLNTSAIIPEPVIIGDDVFIGAGTTILKGVSVGSGAVIGAGAVVVSDIPANVIAAGNPARVVRPL